MLSAIWREFTHRKIPQKGVTRMNKLQEAIRKIKADTDRNELQEKLLQMLLDKEEMLGADITDEEADEAVKDVIKEHLLYALRKAAAEPGNSEDDGWDEDMEDNKKVIHRVFREMDLHYWDHVHQKGVHAFELGVSSKGKNLRVKVYLETSPKVCRIDAVFPFVADQDLAYPLCEKLLAESFPRRYGALQYDARDGELSYRYSFPITHGLHEDDFRTVFTAVVASAIASYDVVRQYAVGRFRRAEREKITCQAQKLIIELDQ